MRSSSLAVALGVLGVIFIVIAALYALGALQIFTSTTSGPHYKHAVLFAVLAVASFVAANFARPRAAV
jgi:hypothetical protein